MTFFPDSARTAASAGWLAFAATAAAAAAPAFPGGPASPTPRPAERDLTEVVVTATRMDAPLVVTADAKAPRQPLPAHDGADYLKTIPGFAVIRKGGADGDPVFRGMAASRVNVEIDGEGILGGCGMRMDPPTAYVYPEAYDRIVIVKGPQTVTHGAGNSAAAVSFERDVPRFTESGARGYGSAMAGSFGRSDAVADLRAGTPDFYGQLSGTHTESDDFDDGDGNTVHSRYRRWSGNGALGWTPGEDTRLELSGALSDGEAAYADRMMDGVKFARENLGLRLERRDLSKTVQRIEGQLFYNDVDHVMDNFSLRPFVPTTMMPGRTVSNPDRRTQGARLELDLGLGGGRTSATVGLERQENRHRLRSTMNEAMRPYEQMARVEDGRFAVDSFYTELTWRAAEGRRVVGGLRLDDWFARDSREQLAIGMMNVANPTAGARRDELLTGGFARFEADLARRPATAWIGFGHVERFPDYWELLAAGKESATSLSAFGTRPERTTQLDAGLLHSAARSQFSLSAFFSDVDDYILVQSNFAKGMRRTTIVRNVDARTWGAEADASFRLADSWTATATLAWTQGENRSDETPLAQMPPLEARFALDYSHAAWSAGALLRLVDEQDRYVVDQGNVVGQDIGPTAGFAVLSLNAGWRPRDRVLVSAGIDNVFDRTFAEHLSRAGAMVAGYPQTTRVNEPGRTLWLKASADFR